MDDSNTATVRGQKRGPVRIYPTSFAAVEMIRVTIVKDHLTHTVYTQLGPFLIQALNRSYAYIPQFGVGCCNVEVCF